MALYRVRIQYGTYTGTYDTWAEDEEHAIAKTWARLRRQGFLTLPMAHQSARAEVIVEDPNQ